MEKICVAVLGGQGLVGSRMVQRLRCHPWFELTHITSSARACGQKCPLTALRYTSSNEVAPVKIAFSALPPAQAHVIEPQWRSAGVAVITNASAWRGTKESPLAIPELMQPTDTLSYAQPNCVVAGLALVIEPFIALGLRSYSVTTMQAISGAGKGACDALDFLDNAMVHIPGEGEKILAEIQQLHGVDAPSTSTTIRAPWKVGHLAVLTVQTVAPIERRAIEARWQQHTLALPSAPAQSILLTDALNPSNVDPMAIKVGRTQWHTHVFQGVVLIHNLERGAAGGALLIAERALCGSDAFAHHCRSARTE